METDQLTSNQNSTGVGTQPQQVSSNNGNLFTTVVISVLLTAIISGSAVYFWQRSVNEKEITVLKQKATSLEKQISTMKKAGTTPQPTSSPELSPTSTINPTVNWKMYTSKNLGFTFRYPSLIIEIKTGDINRLEPAVYLITGSKYSQVQEANVDIAPIVIYVGNVNSVRQDYYYGGYKWTKAIIDSLSSLDVNETKQGTKENITKKEGIIIDELQASRYIANPSEGEEYMGVALIRGDTSYLFVYFPRKSNITETTFNQILSTLQFID